MGVGWVGQAGFVEIILFLLLGFVTKVLRPQA